MKCFWGSELMMFVIGLVVILFSPIHAQQRPDWVNGLWENLPNSYIKVVSGEGRNSEVAYDIAMQNIIKERSIGAGQRSKVSVFNDKTSIQGNNELTTKAHIIDTYIEYSGDGRYRVYLLVQVLKNPSYSYEPVYFTNKYPFSPRVFVPGMAQIHKGTPGKGAGFITGETLFIGGIVASELLRRSYCSKINATRYTALRKEYMDDERICRTVRDASIAGAIIIYVWNVIDGIVAKGQPHLVFGEASLHLSPYTSRESGGLAMSFTF